jgi:cytochrome c-type biogenesis protein CcmH/NrfF
MPGGHRGERRPRTRLAGCLLWILALAALLIVLSLLFGGFRKGTKAGMGPPRPVVTTGSQWGRDSRLGLGPS